MGIDPKGLDNYGVCAHAIISSEGHRHLKTSELNGTHQECENVRSSNFYNMMLRL